MTFPKQRRLVAKLMTIMFRDFPSLLGAAVADQNNLFLAAQQSCWDLTVKNLTYLLPFYQERILFATEEQRQSALRSDTDLKF